MGINEVIVTVGELRRQQRGECIGQIKISLDQITEEDKQTHRKHLVNPKNNLRTASQLTYEVQYQFNEVKQIGNQIKVI